MEENSSGQASSFTPVSIEALQSFLSQLVKATLGATDEDALSLNSKVVESRLSRFASDPNTLVLFIQQLQSNAQESEPRYTYTVTQELDPTDHARLSVAIVKRTPLIVDTIALQDQVQFVNLPGIAGHSDGSSVFEALHSLIKFAISPYFDASSRAQDELDPKGYKTHETKQGIPNTRKKIAELELSLLHLQQNTEVAPVVLAAHPVIQQAIKDAAAEGKRPSINSLSDSAVLENMAVINAIQATTVTWRQQIKQTTEKDRDPYSGTASQEINFWINLDQVLADIELQLKSDPILLTFDVLAAGKRLGINSAMIMQDTGLKDTKDKVKSYNMLMRDFPLTELLSAPSLAKAAEAVEQIFDHVNRRLRTVPYPVARVIPLAEAITRDIESQIYALLRGQRLMHIAYKPFEELLRSTDKVFAAYDNKVRDFVTTARDVLRKRNEKFLVIKVNAAHNALQERLAYLRHFRQGHEQLSNTIAGILGTRSITLGAGLTPDSSGIDLDATQEVNEAYKIFKGVDVLDVSSEGTEAWIAAEQEYDDRIARVETTIINLLRSRLDTATSANEMFRVFSTFNALFVRPKIRGAIQEYQDQLIDGVKGDLSRLQDKFKQQYLNSDTYLISTLRDIPLVSGQIIWARQINRQLDSYMEKVETVLGTGWHLYAEGQKLHAESVIFRKKLDVKPIYDQWFEETKSRENAIKGSIFSVQRNRVEGNKLELLVNFDEKAITLFKEVRNLLHLGFNVPHQINTAAKIAKQVYPHAMSIIESNSSMRRIFAKRQALGDLDLLLAGFHNDVQKRLAQVSNLDWEVFRDESSRSRKASLTVNEWASAVSLLQTKVDVLMQVKLRIETGLDGIVSCAYKLESFQSYLHDLQACIDQLNMEGFVNLPHWIDELNSRLQDILTERAKSAIISWTDGFQSTNNNRHDQPAVDASAPCCPELPRLVHEVILKNQVISLEPPIEFAKATWHAHLSDWVQIVCQLPKLQANRFELTLTHEDNLVQLNFSKVSEILAVPYLQDAFRCIRTTVSDISDYVSKWLQFQSLWDLQANDVWNALGDELANWLQILAELRKARTTFDTSDTTKEFNHLSVNYEQVQARVNAKYDSWQKDIVTKFVAHLSDSMRDHYTVIETTRKDLELQSLDSSTTASAVSFITAVQKCKRMIDPWQTRLDQFKQGQTTLVRHRYPFGNSWLDVEQIEGEWSALMELFHRKHKIAIDQADALKAKILAEDNILNDRIESLLADWSSNKPVAGSLNPAQALSTLRDFSTKLTQFVADSEQVNRAKEALDLEESMNKNLAPILEEVQDFTSVWSAVSTIWVALDDLRESPWSIIVPRKIRSSLDSLNATTREMPTRMRQYAAFENAQTVIKAHIKSIPLLVDLHSEAIRERHWIKLFKQLLPKERLYLSSLTLGAIWDLNLLVNEKLIRGIIVEAQGELALEQFLREVRDYWNDYLLDLVNYQNKCRLIRGWDELFTKCGENLNSLAAMRHSPYFKIFEDDTYSWEDKLTRIHVLFDVWIDVQRQWVYLEGIFTGNADIKLLLPLESSRFSSINAEFFALMKRVNKAPNVLDVITIPNVQKSIERLAEMLQKIQKALGEYLERERAQFPRFYFVGDEDLLEIIGNSKEIGRIEKHLKKMFAGISGLCLNEDQTMIEGFSSKEGEEVFLRKQISLAHTPKVNEWLSALESEMKVTLAILLRQATRDFADVTSAGAKSQGRIFTWLDKFPAQVLVLATQCVWTTNVERAIEQQGGLAKLETTLNEFLRDLSSFVLRSITGVQRSKCESLISAFVHQRDVVSQLIYGQVTDVEDFRWQYFMRFYLTESENPLLSLKVNMASASFLYGFEYLGIPGRLIQTPLTDRCYLTLTQALSQKLGGSPFGPAGTGKTESVKALGIQLGKFVLVFNCDDTFDFQAMGRIFLGLCQVGAWGCFDEFNRLEERMLSAVSQQIQAIQLGLRSSDEHQATEIELVGRRFPVHRETGLFITMNPGYAGRSNLPDNLKKLFRSIAMTRPDKGLIAQVTFYSQGFNHAKALAVQVVPFFDACHKRFSIQAHYDFGLRALKSVLQTCGTIKRTKLQLIENSTVVDQLWESSIVLQSLRETIMPKLVGNDADELLRLSSELFPGVVYDQTDHERLQGAVGTIARLRGLDTTESWMNKVVQLHQILNIHHGVMLVGPAGTGKSETWKALSHGLQELDGHEAVSYVIDAKVMTKDTLYGKLDPTTREWTDGLLTSILRKIVDNLRGEDSKRHWIVFDGDVDPEWVENLNSVLDDNKMLTLPNGERLNLPSNVRIMFEVDSLKNATLATVSRCGMVYFNEGHVSPIQMLARYGHIVSELDSQSADEGSPTRTMSQKVVQTLIADLLRAQFATSGVVLKSLALARPLKHVMDYSDSRALGTLFALTNRTSKEVAEYNSLHEDFVLTQDQICRYVQRKLLLNVIWSFSGDCAQSERREFGLQVAQMTTIDLPATLSGKSIIDFDVHLPDSDWRNWEDMVPTIDIEPNAVLSTDLVIPTTDTVRHEAILYSWLAEHKPLILCGPPGSGKTMTLLNALRKLPDLETVALNFSSASTPELITKTLEQYCEYRKTMNGTILSPAQVGRWLVLFCDEINLPAPDKYGSQRVIAFLRQLIELGGFWRPIDKTWISLGRIQFVGACNPPTDVGRSAFSQRFLRHAPVLMVDYPEDNSLIQIYGTFVRATLKFAPNLRGYSKDITSAMVDLYSQSRAHFTPDLQAHYIYSPREMTRWIRGISEAIRPLETLSIEGLVRVWAHEAHRLFEDRLVLAEEKRWTRTAIESVATEHFPNIDRREALQPPILYSNWLSKLYVPVTRDSMRLYIQARLKTFCEEEVDTPLVLFDEVIDHVLKIDRVFRQPQGHLILIGVSGSGKTTLSRFVAWMNGLKTYQIKVHRKYSAQDFDEDLRAVLRRCGTRSEKICFILDESNMLDTAFLERMNTLLANAEIPGLFEGDDWATLMTACKEGAQRDGLILDSKEELYQWFTRQVVRNLHVVFTMNPPDDLSAKAATSPALFNRCVLNWFGDWTETAYYQVALELMQSMDLERSGYQARSDLYQILPSISGTALTYRNVVAGILVTFHRIAESINSKLKKANQNWTYFTPRHFLDLVRHCLRIYEEKRNELEEQQRHLNVGLDKLQDTVVQVDELRSSLAAKKKELEAKDMQANEKLLNMLNNQKKAEQRKAASLEIQDAIAVQEQEISKRRTVVMHDLALAEPAVIEAQKSVSNIKKQQLTEVRSMANPPEAVKLAMESVCTLLGHSVEGWKSVQSVIRREDFISSIVRFDNETQMTPQLRVVMQREYMTKPNYQFEAVNRASKACGPLVQWVMAQVSYSEILDKVGPLRLEVDELEQEAILTRKKAHALAEMVQELEDSIVQYKAEYADLISQTQTIKSEMVQVERKVKRSVGLLDSLTSERDRWQSSSEGFEGQLNTIIGDVLLSAAFMAYSGFFDQTSRREVLSMWSSQLSLCGIEHKSEQPVTNYLAATDDKVIWQSRGLPPDDLCTENAIMLQRYNRYPLIIDPSGRAMDFLVHEHQARKLIITSFLDDSFVKHLETALRFGNPILINDAEYLDPIVNKILNKEYQKTGGRTLVELGRQDIDISPSFRLYLLTRDPSARFSPDVCSRVSFVNFTITRSSLESQSLNAVLSSERPDIEQKRATVLRSQGEFKVKLQHLEKDLLQALNSSQGNILDDDTVIGTLETLKQEAAEITRKVSETEGVMEELDLVTKEFAMVGHACGSIFSILEQLRTLGHFYQFSLAYFEDIFGHVLKSIKSHAQGGRSPESRCDTIVRNLYMATFRRVSQALLHKDHISLALLLALAYSPETGSDSMLDYLWTGIVSSQDAESGTTQLAQIRHVQGLEHLHEAIDASGQEWEAFLAAENPEEMAPQFVADTSGTDQAIKVLLLIKTFRGDRVIPAIEKFVSVVFGESLDLQTESDLSPATISDTTAVTPIMLCSVPGYDASFKVDAIVEQLSIECTSIAMGSSEGLLLADRAITAAAQFGTWVLLKNVHLAPSWLAQLEKRIHSLKPNEKFRIFLTLESSPAIPVSLIRMSRVLMFEAPPGLRANITDSLRGLSPQKIQQGPVERSRVYLILAWLHATIQERLRYVGIGWTKAYEFNDSDFECARKIVDTWIEAAAGGRTNIAPEKIPWRALRTLLSESVYGGKIDEPADQKELDALVDKYFTPRVFDVDYLLIDTDAQEVKMPDVSHMAQFREWVSELPEREPPTWLGLRSDAQKLMLADHGRRALLDVHKIMESMEEQQHSES